MYCALSMTKPPLRIPRLLSHEPSLHTTSVPTGHELTHRPAIAHPSSQTARPRIALLSPCPLDDRTDPLLILGCIVRPLDRPLPRSLDSSLASSHATLNPSTLLRISPCPTHRLRPTHRSRPSMMSRRHRAALSQFA